MLRVGEGGESERAPRLEAPEATPRVTNVNRVISKKQASIRSHAEPRRNRIPIVVLNHRHDFITVNIMRYFQSHSTCYNHEQHDNHHHHDHSHHHHNHGPPKPPQR